MKNKMYLNVTLTFLFACLMASTTLAQTQTADYYVVKNGEGKGLRLWSDNHNDGRYSVTMGVSSAYKFGPVTNYSIKMSMNNDSRRGWTWGVLNQVPVTALSTRGHFQTKGWMKSVNRTYYFGNVQRLYGDDNSALYWKSNNSWNAQIALQDKEGTNFGRLHGGGNGTKFGLLDGDNNWSYLAVKDDYTSFSINNSEKMRILANGNVGIGTTTPGNKLEVNGTIRAKEIIVETVNWPDYVFYDDYDLPTLEEEEKNIEANGHLLGFESEKDMAGEIQLGDVSKRQQVKIEEVILHLIEMKKEIKQLKEENKQLKEQMSKK